MTASASETSAFVSFGSSEPGAKSSERRRLSAAVSALCQTFGRDANRAGRLLLDSHSKVRHKGASAQS
jgi:hypothetical protein